MNIEILVHPRSDVYSMDVNLFENDVMESKNQILQVRGHSSETEGLWSLSTRATSPREFWGANHKTTADSQDGMEEELGACIQARKCHESSGPVLPGTS